MDREEGGPSVAFVCEGNTCRSPMAEAFARHWGVPELRVESFGIEPGGEVSEATLDVMDDFDTDIYHHKVARLPADVLSSHNLVVFMHKRVLDHAVSLGIISDSKIERVECWDVPDPALGEISYEQARDRIARAVAGLLLKRRWLSPDAVEDIQYLPGPAIIEATHESMKPAESLPLQTGTATATGEPVLAGPPVEKVGERKEKVITSVVYASTITGIIFGIVGILMLVSSVNAVYGGLSEARVAVDVIADPSTMNRGWLYIPFSTLILGSILSLIGIMLAGPTDWHSLLAFPLAILAIAGLIMGLYHLLISGFFIPEAAKDPNSIARKVYSSIETARGMTGFILLIGAVAGVWLREQVFD